MQYNVGRCCKLGRGVRRSLRRAACWYEKAARQGDAQAQVQLAYLYEDGCGVRPDHKKELYWYRKAARQGSPDAQCALGVIYWNGDIVRRSPKTAVKWYKLAAAAGNKSAIRNLALARRDGAQVDD